LDAYETTIAGIVLSTSVAIEGDNDMISSTMKLVAELLIKDEKVISFLFDKYVPALKKALDGTFICKNDKARLAGHLLKFIRTFADALLFQERVVDNLVDGLDGVPGQLGQGAIEGYRKFSSFLTFMERKLSWLKFGGHDTMQVWRNLYGTKGASACRNEAPHSRWHEQAGVGLVEAVKIASFFWSAIRVDNRKWYQVWKPFCWSSTKKKWKQWQK
jgi:hypothetical protein